MGKRWQKRVGRDIRGIKKDLRYHILRTDIIESKVNSVWYKGALTLAFLGGAFGAAKSLLSLFS